MVDVNLEDSLCPVPALGRRESRSCPGSVAREWRCTGCRRRSAPARRGRRSCPGWSAPGPAGLCSRRSPSDGCDWCDNLDLDESVSEAQEKSIEIFTQNLPQHFPEN